jgi:hypothetical protein
MWVTAADATGVGTSDLATVAAGYAATRPAAALGFGARRRECGRAVAARRTGGEVIRSRSRRNAMRSERLLLIAMPGLVLCMARRTRGGYLRATEFSFDRAAGGGSAATYLGTQELICWQISRA